MSISITVILTLVLVTIVHKFNSLDGQSASFPYLVLKSIKVVLGIRSTEHPTSALWRLTWISFVIWFLALRIIYQTEMVEFVIFGVQKPQIKTVDQMRDKNIKLIATIELLNLLDIDSNGKMFK
jgi:hypothetical protein